MKTTSILATVVAGFMVASFTLKTVDQKKPWPVPAAAKAQKNPIAK